MAQLGESLFFSNHHNQFHSDEILELVSPMDFSIEDTDGEEDHSHIQWAEEVEVEEEDSVSYYDFLAESEPLSLDEVRVFLDRFDQLFPVSESVSTVDDDDHYDDGSRVVEEEIQLISDELDLGSGSRLGLGFANTYLFSDGDDADSVDCGVDSGFSGDVIEDLSVVEEGLGTRYHVDDWNSFSERSSEIESSESSVMDSVECSSIGRLSAILGEGGSDLLSVEGYSGENDDFSVGVDGFGVVDVDSDEDCVNCVDCQDDASQADDDDEDVVHDLNFPLRWDSLNLDDAREPNEDEWEEVVGSVIDREEFINPLYEDPERMAVDLVEEGLSSENWDEQHRIGIMGIGIHPESDAADGDILTDSEENPGWAVLIPTGNSVGMEHDSEFFIGDHDDYVYTAEYDMLVGQLEGGENVNWGSFPASLSVIEDLPCVHLKQEDIDSSNNVCAVCRDDVSIEEPVRKLPCTHFFHVDCILPWLRMRNTCPVCRYELPTDNLEYERWRSLQSTTSRI